LTLQSAKTLYLQYTEKKDVSEAQLRERIFLRDRLNNPDFELSSLSTFLTDSVSLALTQRATDIALKIKDGENRTAREQERLKEELETQKHFLHQHLTHMIELEKLQLRLLSHKIDSLQGQTLNLLDAEKNLLKDKLTELNKKMSSLPEKWRRENLLLLKKEFGSRIIGSMTQLVETKNLNQKLYQVSSKHLDLSIPPLKAQHPHLILFSLLAAFLGCFIYYFFKLSIWLIRGFPISHGNLKYSGQSTYGVLSPNCSLQLEQLEENDLSTLRGLAHFICTLPPKSCVALLTGNNPDWSSSLAELLSYSGKKILLVHYTFEQTDAYEGPGLFSYLQGNEKDIPIRHNARFDEIVSGRAWRNAADRLAHPTFSCLIHDLKEKYDYILLQSNVKINRREAQGFCPVADAVIIAARDESQEDLCAFYEWAKRKKETLLAFVCFD
jgi:tyrosine-protein kinase Etk/Wzc